MEKRRDIVERTFRFGVMIINIANQIPKTPAGFVIADQLTRAGTSVGANVEEAQDGSTKKEFIRSMSIALKEAREARYWLKIASETKVLNLTKTRSTLSEVEELIKILITIVKNAKKS